MDREGVDRFEKLTGQIESLYDEVSLLSKKSPNDAVSKFKLGFVNKLLKAANEFLGDEYRPFDEFSVFDPDDLPQNSDVVFILGQYLQCFEKVRADNVRRFSEGWRWALYLPDDPNASEKGWVYIPTVQPKRLRGK